MSIPSFFSRTLAAGLASLALLASAEGQTTSLASLTSTGVQGDGDGTWASISADGRYVAFSSWADNLVVPDTNLTADVYLRDRQSGTTTLVSQSTGGAHGDGHCAWASISANGRYIAFTSRATNLVTGDTNGVDDVFLRDRVAGTTVRVSVGAGGVQGNGESGWQGMAISADGRFVAFESEATNLVAGDTNGISDVFLRDVLASTTTRVSVSTGGGQGTGVFGSTWPSISADGRYVAFESAATNLVAGDANGGSDAFVRDRVSGTTEIVSRNSSGTQGNSGSGQPSISADGRHVAFFSYSTNLDTIPNGAVGAQIYRRDRLLGTTAQVSANSSGTGANSDSDYPSISADGRHVVFQSWATNLAAGDGNGFQDVFVHDSQTGSTEFVSATPAGASGNNNSYLAGSFPAMSSGGRYVVFTSFADNLVVPDSNGVADIFVRDRDMPIDTYCNPGLGGVIACPCGNPPGGPAGGCNNSLATGGASIQGWGTPSLAADTAVVSASGIGSRGVSCAGMQTNLTCILLQGTANLPAGTAFHDGVRCVGGSLKRLELASSSAGTFTSTGSLSAESAALGDPIPAGSSRYYAVWYRDPCGSFACTATANASNGLRIRWLP